MFRTVTCEELQMLLVDIQSQIILSATELLALDFATNSNEVERVTKQVERKIGLLRESVTQLTQVLESDCKKKWSYEAA